MSELYYLQFYPLFYFYWNTEIDSDIYGSSVLVYTLMWTQHIQYFEIRRQLLPNDSIPVSLRNRKARQFNYRLMILRVGYKRLTVLVWTGYPGATQNNIHYKSLNRLL